MLLEPALLQRSEFHWLDAEMKDPLSGVPWQGCVLCDCWKKRTQPWEDRKPLLITHTGVCVRERDQLCMCVLYVCVCVSASMCMSVSVYPVCVSDGT